MKSLRVAGDAAFLPKWRQQEPQEVKQPENDCVKILLGMKKESNFPMTPKEIFSRNRRFIEDDAKVEVKLAKAFDAAQRRKDDVFSQELSKIWLEAQPEYFEEQERVQGMDCQGSTMLLNRSDDGLGICCTQGWKEQMEDFHLVSSFPIEARGRPPQNITMYGVFDGHSGRGCADYLQTEMARFLKKQLDGLLSVNTLSETAAIFNVLKCACVHLGRKWVQADYESKSTALIALVIGDHLWVANVGDSRAILLDGDETIALSIDAKPNDEIFINSIRKRGGRVEQRFGNVPRVLPVGCAVARAVGYAEVDTGITARAKIIRYPLTSPHKKTLILASDGLWDFAFTNQVAAAVRAWRAANPDISSLEIAQRLVKKTCQAAEDEAAIANRQIAGEPLYYPQGDNLTVMVADLPVARVQVAGG